MKLFGKKIRLIFLPYLCITTALLIVYTFLHWVLFIKITLFTINEEIVNFWGAIVIPWIPIWLWLRPRVKLLNLKTKSGKGDPIGAILFLSWIAMGIPLIIAQTYLVTATGKLTQLNNIKEINNQPLTKYYKINHLYIDKKLSGFKAKFEVTGKYNESFNMNLYAAVPVYDTDHTVKYYNYNISSPHSAINSWNALIVINGKIADQQELHSINPRSIGKITILKGEKAKALYGNGAENGVILIQTKQGKFADTLLTVREENASYTPFAWIGVHYEKTISNKLSADEKEARYKDFANESQADFNAKDLRRFVYLDRINYNDDFKGYVGAISNNSYYNSVNTATAIIFSPVTEPFEARNGQQLLWIFVTLGGGAVIFFVILVFVPLREETSLSIVEEEEKQETASTTKFFQGSFFPRKGFAVTPLLVDANILIFIIMAVSGLGFISFQAHDLLRWGGNFRPAIDKGEYWRLLTNIFLHGGLMHVLFNMYGLFFVGIFLEPKIGSAKFLFAYLLTGIVASIASVWWHPETVSIGASGAIFGLYGVFLALITVNIYSVKAKKGLLINTSVFIGYNLLFGLTGGVDNAAHIGGLLSGVILGYIIYLTLKDKAQLDEADTETDELMDELNEKPQEELSNQESE